MYTDEDIKKELRQAKYPEKQIGILVDLGYGSKEHIVDIYNELYPDKAIKKKRGGCDVTAPKEQYYWTEDDEALLRAAVTRGDSTEEIYQTFQQFSPAAIRSKMRRMGIWEEHRKLRSGTRIRSSETAPDTDTASVPEAEVVTDSLISEVSRKKETERFAEEMKERLEKERRRAKCYAAERMMENISRIVTILGKGVKEIILIANECVTCCELTMEDGTELQLEEKNNGYEECF